MTEDPKWELAILATVQGFYEKLLQGNVQGEVPVPAGLEAISLQEDGDVQETLAKMRRWLRLLDMAITPAMLRLAFTSDTDPEIAEAMLRYFTRTKDSTDVHRDKTDLVVTFLYRHPRVPGQWERRGYGLDGSLPLSPFEIALLEILADSDAPLLAEEHVQLLRRFDPLLEQVNKFRDLNALIESGIIPLVRELKQSLDVAFYHPGVLATIAPYNASFGKRFDELFHSTAAEIKNFAEDLQEQGGSILGTVDGVDVTVEHVAAMHEGELLKLDYLQATDKFRRVSQLKKVLERRPPVRRKPQLVRPPAPANSATGKQNAAPGTKPTAVAARRPVLDVKAMRSAVTPQQISAEETKLLKIEESIRIFVRVADPKFRQIVPMRFFNLALTSAEADAYCADYLEEKSLRAGVARVLLRLVAVCARITTEAEELKRSENSPSIWKLHADSLLALLELSRAINEHGERMTTLAGQHGSAEEVTAIQASVRKLQDTSESAIMTLTGARMEKGAGAAAH
ncbi:MAG: hypothetical protein JWO91_3327 [Acidobacteriaceae bacterium]|nr:hypothetical protein [Acidobacteriaceae bacterium]